MRASCDIVHFAGNDSDVGNTLILQALLRPTLHCSSHSQFHFVQVAVCKSLAVMNFSNDECSRTQIRKCRPLPLVAQLRPTRSMSATRSQFKNCTQFVHSVSNRISTSLQVVEVQTPFTATRAVRNSPQLGRSHRHQNLDSVRPAAVNRRPASKPNCGRSQNCVRASRQLVAPLALRCNVRCTFVDDRLVCGYGRSLRRCPCAAARASVADRSAGARGTEFTTRTDLQSQTGTSGPKWSEIPKVQECSTTT